MRISDWSSDVCSSDLIEGHADERGTREYNLALGDRRANAVRDYLVALGTNPARLSTVSYGEERPAVLGSNDSAWAQNRRGVFVVNCGATGVSDCVGNPVRPDASSLGRAGFYVFPVRRSEEHTSELQSLMRISYAVFCLKKQTK